MKNQKQDLKKEMKKERMIGAMLLAFASLVICGLVVAVQTHITFYHL